MQEATPRLKITLQYLGTAYAGSQIQQNSITIQELLNTALKKLFASEDIHTVFSGRTDSGVHALCQPVHLQVNKSLRIENIRQGLQSLLPSDIRIENVEYVREKFHARYDAKKREYLYNIFHGQKLPLHLKELVWFIPDRHNLNIGLMKKAAGLLRGTKDFSGFCAAGSASKSKTRTIFRSELKLTRVTSWPGTKDYLPGKLITYRITANGFLYHMVRNIVGALVSVGNNRMTVAEFKTVLMQHKKRTKLRSSTAPSAGLVLKKVIY